MARKKSPPNKKAAKSKLEQEFYKEFLKAEKANGKKKPAPKGAKKSKASSGKPGAARTDSRKKSEIQAPGKSASPRKQNIAGKIAKKYSDKNGVIRLRDNKGRIVDQKTQEAIFKAARALDAKNVPYTYEQLLEVPQIAELFLVIEDKTPNDLFYWNALSLVEADNKNSIVGPLTKKYVIHTPEGEIIETNSNDQATFLMMQFNDMLAIAEELAEEEGDSNPYLTVEVKFTRNINDDILKIEIDYSRIGGRIPTEEISDYVTRAYNGEKPKRKNKAGVKKNSSQSQSGKNSAGGGGAQNKPGAQKSNSGNSKKRSGGKGAKR